MVERRRKLRVGDVLYRTGGSSRPARPPRRTSNPAAGLLRLEDFYRPRDVIFRPRRMIPRLCLLPPPFNSCELLTLDGLPPPGWRFIYPKRWEGKIAEAYHQFWQALDKEHPNACGYHQVGGIAFPETAPVEAECIKYGDDDYSNNPPEEEKAFRERREKDGAPVDWPDYEEWSQAFHARLNRERATYFERAGNWQLVLQLAWDDEIGSWGEGHAYVCIRKADLAECRFDRC